MTLYVNNRGLIHDRARRMAEAYHCIRMNDRGQWSRYTKETLSELESVGILAFLECVRSGKYDSTQGSLTTFIVPFLDGAMRRHFEKNLGTLSLERDSMALVRRAQQLHDGQGKDVKEVAERLGIPVSEAAKHIAYSMHFLSVYDLADWDEDNDVFDYIAEDRASAPPAETVYRRVQMECLRELFHRLPKKDRDILGKCFGAFGYPKTPLREIAMYHLNKRGRGGEGQGSGLEETAEGMEVQFGAAVEYGAAADRTGGSLRRVTDAGLSGLVGAWGRR